MTDGLDLNERIVLNAIFAKIDKTAFSLSTGMVFFLTMFVITTFSILKNDGESAMVGPDLIALAYYLPGYSLTWVGNFVGSLYVGIIGLALGWLFGMLWNLTHYLYLAILMNKINFFKID